MECRTAIGALEQNMPEIRDSTSRSMSLLVKRVVLFNLHSVEEVARDRRQFNGAPLLISRGRYRRAIPCRDLRASIVLRKLCAQGNVGTRTGNQSDAQ
jgi:hypothetical protein